MLADCGNASGIVNVLREQRHLTHRKLKLLGQSRNRCCVIGGQDALLGVDAMELLGQLLHVIRRVPGQLRSRLQKRCKLARHFGQRGVNPIHDAATERHLGP